MAICPNYDTAKAQVTNLHREKHSSYRGDSGQTGLEGAQGLWDTGNVLHLELGADIKDVFTL